MGRAQPWCTVQKVLVFAALLLLPASPLLPGGDIRHCTGECSGIIRQSIAFWGDNTSAVVPIAPSSSIASGGVSTFTFEVWLFFRSCVTPSCKPVHYWGNRAQHSSGLEFAIEMQATPPVVAGGFNTGDDPRRSKDEISARSVLMSGVLGGSRM